MGNKAYHSEALVNMYKDSRKSWEEFYPSERYIMERVFTEQASPFSLLDMGCGCGGLAVALQDRFMLKSYTGVDISEGEIAYAQRRTDIRIPHDFLCKDICEWEDDRKYDVVMSLSCVDFNEDVDGMLGACWDKVRGGGILVSSFRLTEHESILKGAYQYIMDADAPSDETYNYVVFNPRDLLKRLCALDNRPDRIQAYGYWGAPSPTAVVPYEKLCFSVFALHKPETDEKTRESYVKLELPTSILL